MGVNGIPLHAVLQREGGTWKPSSGAGRMGVRGTHGWAARPHRQGTMR